MELFLEKNIIKLTYLESFPKNILVQETLNFLGIFLFSTILFKYKLWKNKQIKSNNRRVISLNSNSSSSSSSEIILIYNKDKNNRNIKGVSPIFLLFIVFLLFLSKQLKNIFNNLDLYGLDYWMPEILFIVVISVHIFKISIFLHKTVAIVIIIIFSTTMKAFSTYNIITISDGDNNNNNNNNNKLYKKYSWIIPKGIIGFILFTLIRGYTFCRLKWIFDLKYISEIKILIIYGIIGSIFCLIGSIISSNIKCIDKNIFKDITYICKVKVEDATYYDHFLIYFQNIVKEDNEWWKNTINIILMLFKIFFSFLYNLYMVLIIKYLSPEYLICSKYIFYFIIDLLAFINDNNFYVIFFNLSAEIFAIFGVLLYLEFIELKCCKLDYYLKKNIIKRSYNETRSDMYIEGDNDNDSESNF